MANFRSHADGPPTNFLTDRQDSMTLIPAITNLFESTSYTEAKDEFPPSPLSASGPHEGGESGGDNQQRKSAKTSLEETAPPSAASAASSAAASASPPPRSPPSGAASGGATTTGEPPPPHDTTQNENSSTAATDASPDIDKRPSKSDEDPQKVFETFKRGGAGGQRRMTFRMQQVPDAVIKGADEFVQEAKAQCGEDVILEDVPSDEELWIPREADAPTLTLLDGIDRESSSAEAQKEFEAALMLELDKANDETDILHGRDDLGELNAGSESQPPPVDNPDVNSSDTKKAAMDPLALRLWFMKLRNSYKGGVKLVKVNSSGKKYVRTVTIAEEHLQMTSPNKPNKIHLSSILQIKLGYTSPELRNLLDITNEQEPVPPPSVCAVVLLPNRSLSLIFPSESSRNEFLYLMRVEVREAKRRYGDTSARYVKNDVKI